MAKSRSRGFGGQAVVSVLGAVALVSAGLAAVFGSGSAARSLPLRDGAAWVQSQLTGSIERLDTGSGAVGFRLTTPLASQPLEIVDDGTTTYLRDPATGTIRAIDLSGATAKLSAPADLAREARLVSGAGRTFVLLPERGELAVLDPTTLAVGEMVDLGGPLGSAAVDGAGTLWVAVPSLGVVLPVTADEGRLTLGDRADVGEPGTQVQVTVSAGVAYGVDRAAGLLLRLQPGRATTLARVPVDAVVAEAQGDPADGHIVLGDPSGAVVRVDPSNGRTTRYELPERSGHKLGPPVQARNRIAVPDLTTGELIVIDPATGTFEGAPVHTGPSGGPATPGDVPVKAVDGAVVANDPRSATVVVVTPIGDAEVVDKGGAAPGDTEPVISPAPAVVPTPDPLPQPGVTPSPSPSPSPGSPAAPLPGPAGPAPVLPTPGPGSTPPPGRPPTPPGAVQGLGALAGNATVDLTWTAASDGGSALTGHRVECSGPGGSSAVAETDGAATTASVQGLDNGVDHTCTVVARNTVGPGPAARSGPVRPLGSVPGMPTSVIAVPGDGSIGVQWTAPTIGGAPVTGYVITASGPSGSVIVERPATPLSTIVGGLVNGSPYAITVRARAASGAVGPTGAAPGPVTPAGLPGAPQAVSLVVRSRAIDVSWQPAAPNGSPVTGYVVRAEPGGHVRQLQGDASQVPLDGLQNGTEYTVTVTAANGVGAGPASAAKKAKPGAPEITTFGVASVGGTNLEVTLGVDWKGEQPGACGVTTVRTLPDRTVKQTFPNCSSPSYQIDTQLWGMTFSVTAWASYAGGEATRGPVTVTTAEPAREYLTRSMNENPRDWFFGLQSEGIPYSMVQESGIWVYTDERPGTVRLHRWSAGPNVHWYGTQIQAPPPGYYLDKTVGWIYNFTYTGPTGTGIKRFVRQDFQGPAQGLDCYLVATDFPVDSATWTDEGLMGYGALPP